MSVFSACCSLVSLARSPYLSCLSQEWGVALYALAAITLASVMVPLWNNTALLVDIASRYSCITVHTHTHKHTHSHSRSLSLFLPPSLSPSLQAYYRRGVALQGLERHEEAMIVFAEGLSADPKQAPMLHGLIETMIKSPYRGEHRKINPV